MNLSKKQIYILLGISSAIATTLLIIILIKRKRKTMSVIVKGEYSVPENVPYRADALHSFESRKLDGFGGKMSTKIREALMKMYNEGINPEVTELKVNVDSTNYKVTWEAKLEPSKDGKAYIGFVTRGSAGSNADARALDQIAEMKKKVGGQDYKVVLNFVNPKGIYIRQYFYTYTKPKEFPKH